MSTRHFLNVDHVRWLARLRLRYANNQLTLAYPKAATNPLQGVESRQLATGKFFEILRRCPAKRGSVSEAVQAALGYLLHEQPDIYDRLHTFFTPARKSSVT